MFEQKAKQFVPRLVIDLGLTQIQACGIFGNVGAETGGFKHKQEINPTVKGSRGGYGWFQWTGPRRKQFEAYAKSLGFDLYNLDEDTYHEVCYAFMVHECKTTEAKSIVGLKKTTTVEAATETFMKLNLRPGVPHLDDRIRWGKRALAAVQGIKPSDIKPTPKPPTPAPEVGTAAGGILATIITAWQYSYRWAIAIAITTIIALVIFKIVKRKVNEQNEEPDSPVVG